MGNQFDSFAMTPLGRRILHVMDQPDRLAEYRAFSREGYPAVTALVSELTPVLEPVRHHEPKSFNLAKQFVGNRVGIVMREAGYAVAKAGVRVPGKLFTVAALWAPANA